MSNQLNLTSDERNILNTYINQYNQVQNQIAQLQESANSIHENMQIFISSLIRNNNQINNSRTNTRNNSNSNNSNNTNNNINRNRNNNINTNNVRTSNQTQNLNQNNRSNYLRSNNNLLPLFNTIYEYSFTLDRDNLNLDTNTNFNNLLNNFLNTSVVIRPTEQQIENASRLTRYESIQNPLSESCPISLERFEPNEVVRQIIPCGHIFCEDSFDEWFESNVRCPVCRYDIREYRNGETNTNTNTNQLINNRNITDISTNNIQSNIRNTELRNLDSLLTSLFYYPTTSSRRTNTDVSGNPFLYTIYEP
jgi:hypothetical protein